MIELDTILVSPEKGLREELESARLIEGVGMEGDRFAGRDVRQISMCAAEEWAHVRTSGGFCARFAANLFTRGMDYTGIHPGMRLKIGDAELEISACGKECHAECPLFTVPRSCDFFRRCVFATVVRGGTVHRGDEVNICK